MTHGDLDAVLAIERAAFGSPHARRIFSEELDREWAYIDLIGDGEQLIGYCNYWLVRDEVHLLNIATHPVVRRRGFASRLLTHLIGFARARACRYVTLEVRRDNRGAIDLYRRFGFEAVGVRPKYYVEDGEDAVVMLLSLDARQPIVDRQLAERSRDQLG
jgi:ribosomal-protein-alanine N-acetyltransferase